MEAAIIYPVNLHLQAAYTYLPVGYYFDRNGVALDSVGHFYKLPELVKEILQGSKRAPQVSKSKQPLLCSSRIYGSLLQENHFLDDEVKFIKKMGDHMANFCKLVGPQPLQTHLPPPPLDEYLFQG
ncbi:ferritin light chain 2-like [Nannospalax galili]|uniref:ferritin light chain 2-like n=1 Tax=Nannospalax galili TaxID=1026970 RepID=UPI0004ED404A|nr:ferritin light chain 2-like [Nannospalax galili]